MDLRAILLPVLALEPIRCRSYMSPYLPLVTSPLPPWPGPAFIGQGDTTVEKLHARKMSHGLGVWHSPVGLCSVLSFKPSSTDGT
jgi:hypothetical protein